MKKVKIMLMSLALLAVVGGALAFKARQIIKYCTAPFQNNHCNRGCPNLTTSTTTASGGTVYCTTNPIFVEIQPGVFFYTCIVNGIQLACGTTTRITDDF